MTPLRSRMIEDMQLHGYSPSTQRVYLSSVAGLANHYHKSPELISEEELRQYFLDLTLVQKVSRATATIALCAIKFLFQKTLQRAWTSLDLIRPPKLQKLPVVLSREEVSRILACVGILLYRICLTTIYACGLRISEGAHLQIQDVDSSRMLVRVLGKGPNYAKVVVMQRCHAAGTNPDPAPTAIYGASECKIALQIRPDLGLAMPEQSPTGGVVRRRMRATHLDITSTPSLLGFVSADAD